MCALAAARTASTLFTSLSSLFYQTTSIDLKPFAFASALGLPLPSYCA